MLLQADKGILIIYHEIIRDSLIKAVAYMKYLKQYDS